MINVSIWIGFKMIWGRTHKQKEATKRKVGTEAIRFIWFPDQMKDGRWCWLVWARCVYKYSRGAFYYWSIKEVISKPEGRRGVIA
jgi:hypothetical protein